MRHLLIRYQLIKFVFQKYSNENDSIQRSYLSSNVGGDAEMKPSI